MTEREQSEDRRQIEQTIAALEAQRAALGNAVADASIAALREKLAVLAGAEASEPTMEGERRLVTVMFADLSGFTAMAERMDPEAVRDLVNACFERLAPVVAKYEGMVDKFIGDEIMALFGAPVAHENDAERALRAALEMVDALAKFNAERGADLGLHFGINTGHVIAGLESALVGRQAEFRALAEAVERLQAGLGGIVTLVAEAGLGKSRLVAEVKRSVARNRQSAIGNPQWVEGRCLSYGASIAYLLWLDVLRGLLGVTPEAAPVAVSDVLRERVQALRLGSGQALCPGRSEEVTPYLARLMSLPLTADDEAVMRGRRRA